MCILLGLLPYNLDQLGTTVAIPLLIGVVSAWITASLALRQFRSEKLWEMKLCDYRTVFDSLHRVKDLWVKMLCASQEGVVWDQAKQEQVESGLESSLGEIAKIAERAMLFLNEDAHGCLNLLLQDMKQSPVEGPARVRKWIIAIDNRRVLLVTIARKDLAKTAGWRLQVCL
jgi:hypothetical protein